MDTQKLMELSNKTIATTYGRYPVILVRGEGTRVWDSEGKVYYDFVSGIAVNNLGHCHPKVVEAIRRQAGTLIHVSNLYYILPQIELSNMLQTLSFADRSFFCNSGAEANEAAIKLARKYAHDHFGEKRYEIITMEQSFHGRTLATISATGQPKYKKGFEPVVSGFTHVPFNDLGAVEKAISEQTCAIMVEPIQGEGGVNVPDQDYLKGLRELCDKYKLLLIYDEVQTGIGRTGKLFAYEHYDVPPDIMTLAKSLAGGVPIGAMLAREEVAQSLVPGTHASTFGGNPLATAAAVAALQAIQEEQMIENCQRMGQYFLGRLEELRQKYGFIKEVRGKGLLIGMELDRPGSKFVTACMEQGFLINCTMDTVLRFIPPLIITSEEIDKLIELLDSLFAKE